MQYAAKGKTSPELVLLRETLETVIKGLGFCLIELTVSMHRGSVQVRAVILNQKPAGSVGTDDCSKVHRAITPRLELAFPEREIYLEVSSPGVDRLIKCGAEFVHYTGRVVRCYRTDISDWTAGVLQAVDENGIVIYTKEGNLRLEFDIIAKARLGQQGDLHKCITETQPKGGKNWV